MPVQDFALDAAATQRIQIHWSTDSEPATVLLNGKILGSLANGQERIVGKDFVLQDSSLLHIQFFENGPQAWLNRLPLAPVAAVADPLPQKKRGGCLTAWLILNLVVVCLFTGLYLLASFGALVSSNTTLPAWIFLLFTLLGIIGIVGLSMLLAWKKIGFYLVAAYVLLNFGLAFPLGLFNGNPRTFTPLIGLAVLYILLRRNSVWEHLT